MCCAAAGGADGAGALAALVPRRGRARPHHLAHLRHHRARLPLLLAAPLSPPATSTATSGAVPLAADARVRCAQGVQFFMGRFWACVKAAGTQAENITIQSSVDCLNIGLRWQIYPYIHYTRFTLPPMLSCSYP